jgi:hypothetical protein
VLCGVEPSDDMGRSPQTGLTLLQIAIAGRITRRTCMGSCISTQRLDGSAVSRLYGWFFTCALQHAPRPAVVTTD